MTRVNDALVAAYLRQLLIVAKHQDLATDNEPNQLCDMVEALSLFADAIGNANSVGIASIDEDAINVLIERSRLLQNEQN